MKVPAYANKTIQGISIIYLCYTSIKLPDHDGNQQKLFFILRVKIFKCIPLLLYLHHMSKEITKITKKKVSLAQR